MNVGEGPCSPIQTPTSPTGVGEEGRTFPAASGSLHGGSTANQLSRESQSARGRHDRRLDAFADRDLEHAVGVLQFGDLDDGFTFAADVDEGDLRTNGDDPSLDRLPSLVLHGLTGRFEQRREIFLGFAH